LQTSFRSFAASTHQKQLNLMLFGAPGVGKGTYSKLMEKEYDFKTFSMGDYFRALTKDSTNDSDPFITNIKKILREGALVDDKLVVDIIKNVRT